MFASLLVRWFLAGTGSHLLFLTASISQSYFLVLGMSSFAGEPFWGGFNRQLTWNKAGESMLMTVENDKSHFEVSSCYVSIQT